MLGLRNSIAILERGGPGSLPGDLGLHHALGKVLRRCGDAVHAILTSCSWAADPD